MGDTFAHYLQRRGFDLRDGTPAFLRRMFIDCWTEPGFHRFWRLWNPLYGYFLFRLYRGLGGSRRPVLATMVVFVFCGFVLHDLPVSLIRGRGSVACTVAFVFYGLATLVSRRLIRGAAIRWPAWSCVVVNLGLVATGLIIGALAQHQVPAFRLLP